MTKYKVSRNDLINSLLDQVEALTILNKHFDKGETILAQDIATRLRILLHTTEHSKGLLSQLNLMNISFINTSAPLTSNTAPFSMVSLVITHLKHTKPDKINYRPSYRARLSDTHKIISDSFYDWWNQIIFSNKSLTMTRRQLVLAITNTDGGAHVDSELDMHYYLLKQKSADLTVSFSTKQGKFSFHLDKGINYALVRQISYEVLETLKPDIKGLKKELKS